MTVFCKDVSLPSLVGEWEKAETKHQVPNCCLGRHTQRTSVPLRIFSVSHAYICVIPSSFSSLVTGLGVTPSQTDSLLLLSSPPASLCFPSRCHRGWWAVPPQLPSALGGQHSVHLAGRAPRAVFQEPQGFTHRRVDISEPRSCFFFPSTLFQSELNGF